MTAADTDGRWAASRPGEKAGLEPLTLEQAEEELRAVGAELQTYGDFDRAPKSLLLAFREAADRRDRAAAQERAADDD